MSLRQIEKNITVSGSVQNGLMVSKAVRQFGEEVIMEALAAAILMTASMFNVGNNISDGQAILLASDLMDKYPTENIEDFLLMLKNIRTSGMKLYGKFDYETIFSEMDNYMDLKITERERQYQEQKKEFDLDTQRICERKDDLRDAIRKSTMRYILENK